MSLLLLLFACDAIEDSPGPGGESAADGTEDAVATGACLSTEAVGWSEATHTKGEVDYDRVFPRDGVQRLDLTICPEDYAVMLADLEALLGGAGGGNPPPAREPVPDTGGAAERGHHEDDERPDMSFEEPVFVPATLAYEDGTWPFVGVRFKGNSSLLSSYMGGVAKLPLRLDLDEYEDAVVSTEDQRFHGFQKLSLGPAYYDPSFLHEVLAGEIFEEAGLPVARSAFYEVWIDVGEGPTYWGLYTVLEDPENDAFLERTFGDDKGNLYQPEDGCADWTCFNAADFAKETNAEAADWSDVEAAIAALSSDPTDAEGWRSALEAHLDVDSFLRWLAVSTAIGNWDSYGLMPHNYFLYGDPAQDGRLVWIPWDHNMALAEGMEPLLSIGLDEVDEAWPLIRFLLDDPVYAARYDELVAEHRARLDLDAFAARASALHETITPYVEAEEAPYTQLSDMRDFEGSVEELVEWMDARDTLVAEHLSER